MRKYPAQRSSFTFARGNAKAYEDKHQRSQHLQHKSGGKLAKADEQRGLTHIAKIGAILPVALKINHIAGKRIDAGVERRECAQRAKREMAVMHDAVWVPVGLTHKFSIGLRLETGTKRVAILLVND